MSATGRGAERVANDFYATPAWCVHRLLDRVALPSGGHWLEPACGDGAIIRAVQSHGDGARSPRWTALDLNPQMPGGIMSDFLQWKPPARLRYRVCFANPPYRLAMDFVRRAHDLADITVMLLRLNWLASAERCHWLRRHMPDVYVLPNRPSFTGKGADSTEYAWLLWGYSASGGHISILDETPVAERRGAVAS